MPKILYFFGIGGGEVGLERLLFFDARIEDDEAIEIPNINKIYY